MSIDRRRVLRLAAGAAVLPVVASGARAQSYPERPITLIVPFPPGGLTDVVGRLAAEGMRPPLGQPVVVENIGGATGSIGTGRVARAPADGYTLALGIWNTHVANGATYPLQYDIVSDFEPIALLADAPLLVVARASVPANDLRELIAWLTANPGKASMGTTGTGGPAHLLALLMEQETGTRFNMVPYRGTGPAMRDVVGGQIDLTIANTASALPLMRAGSIKAFVITSKRRVATAPEVPSVDEAGLSRLQFSLWAGLFAPRGTPRDIIDKLNAAAVSAMADPAIRQKLVDQGCEIPPREQQTPAALAAYQKAEIEKWWPIIKAAGIKAE